MKTYTFNIEYMVPEFAIIDIETKGNTIKARALAMEEFMRMYPEAIDPVIIND